MTPLNYLAFVLLLINYSVFIVSAKVYFDASKEASLSRFFYVIYAVLVLSSLYGDFTMPTNSFGPLLIAMGCCLLSLTLFWATIQVTKKRPLTVIFSTDEPAFLFEHGPYRYIRHPYYTSYLLTYLASAMLSSSPLPSICCCTAFCLYLYGARGEEKKFLSSGLATQYQLYQKRTGRFFPRLPSSLRGESTE